tara:strand:- start:1421 stop:2137 length:717 start_codon:yes stop_codon:yes gene_type:complete
MQILPAIDILNGNCVRLIQGDFNQETVFSTNPPEMAKTWESEGAEVIHIVDLNGAKTGMLDNKSIIEDIVKHIKIPIQVGGGIRSLEIAKTLIDCGVSRIVLGTIAINNRELLQTLISELGSDKIIIALDGKDGNIAINGWQDQTNQQVTDVACDMKEYGIQRIMYTDISKDGVLNGPNLNTTQDLTRIPNLNVIASGGISSLQDIQRVKNIGCEGAILGKSLYERIFTLKEAIDAAN